MVLKLVLDLTGQGKDVLQKQEEAQRAKDRPTNIMGAVGYMGDSRRVQGLLKA